MLFNKAKTVVADAGRTISAAALLAVAALVVAVLALMIGVGARG